MRELLEKKNVKIFVGVLAVFAIGLVGFYVFSAPYGDGLEVTMDEAGVGEAEPVYSGPLDYGENYFMSLAMGIAGFVVTLLVAYGIIWLLRKKNATQRD